jgi:hypothetical protein
MVALVGCVGDILVRHLDHAIHRAAADIVYEGVKAVPPRVAGRQNVGFGEVDVEVSIRV